MAVVTWVHTIGIGVNDTQLFQAVPISPLLIHPCVIVIPPSPGILGIVSQLGDIGSQELLRPPIKANLCDDLALNRSECFYSKKGAKNIVWGGGITILGKSDFILTLGIQSPLVKKEFSELEDGGWVQVLSPRHLPHFTPSLVSLFEELLLPLLSLHLVNVHPHDVHIGAYFLQLMVTGRDFILLP